MGIMDKRELTYDELVFQLQQHGIEMERLRQENDFLRKQHEINEKDKEQAEKYFRIFNLNPSAVALSVFETGEYIEVNESFLRIFGLKRDQVIGKTSIELKLLTAKTRKSIMDGLKGATSIQNYPIEIKNYNGDLRYGIFSGEILVHRDKKLWITVMQDVTDIKKMELELKKSEERFRNYINSTSDIVYTLDCNQRHTGIYGNWVERFGFNVSDFMGKTPGEIMGDFAAVHLEANQKALKGETVVYEWLSQKDNAVNYFQTSVTPLIVDGEVSGLIGIGREITKLKQIENELRSLNATKDKLFSIISHDLRNPFNAIIGFSQIIHQKCIDHDYESVEKFSKHVYLSAQRSYNLLNNLLLWSGIQTGRLAFNLVELSLHTIVLSIMDLFDASLNHKNILFQNKVEPSLSFIADSMMIESVLRNLISNAIKYTPSGGAVIVSAYRDDNEIIISVRDNGLGMEISDIKNLQGTDFKKTSPGTNNESGSGLGLTICNEFIVRHGGRLEIESSIGNGSTFKVILPQKSHI